MQTLARIGTIIGLLWINHSACGAVVDSQIWINEFHYDNVGSDSGEFIEIIAPQSFGDLNAVTLITYNGSDGSAYGSYGLDSFQLGLADGGFQIYLLEFPTARLQNGAPDGLALVHATDGVLQFLSYEGTLTATSGPAVGLLSTDIGVLEPTNTAVGFSLQLTGTGDSYGDFAWSGPLQDTRGSWNAGQSASLLPSSSVPEPSTLSLAGTTLLVLSLRRFVRRRSCTRARRSSE